MELRSWWLDRKGKLVLLLVMHVLAILTPVLFTAAGVTGQGSYKFWFLYAVVESAVLFYGADIFESITKHPYLLNFGLHLLIGGAAGFAFRAFGTTEIYYHDGSCVPMGGPILIVFPMTTIENLIITIPMWGLWFVIRWLEQGFQTLWFRKNLRKSFRNAQ